MEARPRPTSASSYFQEWVELRVAQSKQTLTKREVKQFEKEARVLQRVREGLKPAEVAKRLKVGVDVVYKLLAQVKRSAKRQTSNLVK